MAASRRPHSNHPRGAPRPAPRDASDNFRAGPSGSPVSFLPELGQRMATAIASPRSCSPYRSPSPRVDRGSVKQKVEPRPLPSDSHDLDGLLQPADRHRRLTPLAMNRREL